MPEPTGRVCKRGRLRRVLGITIVLALLGLSCSFAWAQYEYQAAKQAVARHDLDEADRHLNRCPWPWDSRVAVQALAAQVARRRGATHQAEQHLSDWASLGGDPEAIQLERDLLRAQQGDLDGLEEPLKARAGNPADTLLVLEALSKGYLSNFRAAEALSCLDHILTHEPAHVPALLLQGQALELHNRRDLALADYKKAVALAPTCRQARLGLARVLYALGHPWEAAGHFDGLREESSDPEVFLGLARCQHDLSRLAEAGELLDALLAKHPNHATALRERGEIAFRLGQLTDAESWLRRAVVVSPHDPDTHRLLLVCLEKQDKTEDAKRVLAQLTEIEAEMLRLNRLIDRAIEAPKDADLQRRIGLGLLKVGRAAEGLPWLFRAARNNAQAPACHAALADYFEGIGQKDRGEVHRRLAALPPKKHSEVAP